MTVGSPILDTVSINYVDVNNYKTIVSGVGCWALDEGSGRLPIKTAKIYLSANVIADLDIDDTLYGKSVTIQRGVSSATESYVFRGEVINFSENGGRITIIAADKLTRATKRKVTKSFNKNIGAEAGSYSEIFKTLVNDYTTLTADNTSVISTGDLIINEFICRSTSVYDRLKKLVDTLGWRGYYDPNTDKVHLEPEGYVNQTTTVEVGVNIVGKLSWDNNTDQVFNKVEVRGSHQEIGTTETGQIGVTSGYTTTSVGLGYKPKSVKVYADSSNPPTTLRTGGGEGIEEYDYSVGAENREIIWNTTEYTPGGSDYVIVEYTHLLPTPVIVQDDASIAKYSDEDPPEPKEITLHKLDITDREDAEIYATQYLNDHKDSIVSTTAKIMDISDLQRGQKVPVSDSINNKAGDFYVTGLKIAAPYKHDTVQLSSNIIDENEYSWEVQQRIKRLEEREVGDSDTLLHTFSSQRTRRLFRRYSKVNKRAVIGAFILGHPRDGVLGVSTLGNNSIAWSTIQLIPGNNTYEEYIVDNEFEGSCSGSYSWNTTTHILSITSGAYTSAVIAQGVSYSECRITVNETTNNAIEYRISRNGGTSWEDIPYGEWHTMTAMEDITAGIVYKISRYPPVAFTPTKYEDGRLGNPAIKIEFR